MTRIVLAAAVLAAALCFEVSSGQAGYLGNAPWCAVINVGDGDVEWECEYRTVEECVPNVLAGNRGFCALNPYPANSPKSAVPLHTKHYAARHLPQH